MSRALQVEWAGAGHALGGQHTGSGDRCWAALTERGARLAVVDGLGHGAEAARAAEIVVGVLEARQAASVVETLQACHEALRETRGAVASVADVDLSAGRMSWGGVGNVLGLLRPGFGNRKHQRLVPVAGVLGGRVPRLTQSQPEVFAGDVLILASDGVDEAVGEAAMLSGAPKEIADALLRTYGKRGDDAAVLVAQFNRGPHGAGED